jgi:protein tyrosine phosphatase (PTP) superfamily phosphohydrolase (DUF442 family)
MINRPVQFVTNFLKLTASRYLGVHLMGPQLGEIYNFLRLCDQIATAGQPTVEQFAAVQQAGYRHVINLALVESANALPNERDIVEALGLQYHPIPVIWEAPQLADFEAFLQQMQAIESPVFVHCAANMRVSAFLYLYRRVQEMGEEEARSDLQKIWTPNPTWQSFIQQVLDHYQIASR